MTHRFFSLLFGLILSTTALADHFTGKIFTLHTDSFSNQGLFPKLYTCDGANISPQLGWGNPPAKTKSFTLILKDPNAPSGTFYHWIIYNIPADITSFHENMTTLPTGALPGKNSFGTLKYAGPCPPKGATHAYIFTIYALDRMLDVPAGIEGPDLIAILKQHTLDEEDLITTYGR